MGDLTQVQLLPAESGTARHGEPDLTEQEIALIVTAGGGRYVGLLQNIPGRMETVILFASPQTETTLGLCMSRFNVEAVRERIAKSDELFAKAAANVCGAGVLLRQCEPRRGIHAETGAGAKAAESAISAGPVECAGSAGLRLNFDDA